MNSEEYSRDSFYDKILFNKDYQLRIVKYTLISLIIFSAPIRLIELHKYDQGVEKASLKISFIVISTLFYFVIFIQSVFNEMYLGNILFLIGVYLTDLHHVHNG